MLHLLILVGGDDHGLRSDVCRLGLLEQQLVMRCRDVCLLVVRAAARRKLGRMGVFRACAARYPHAYHAPGIAPP